MRSLIVALLIIVAVVLAFFFFRKDSEPEPVDDTPPAVEQVEEEGPDDEEAAPETVSLPRFDLIRVDRSGYAVVSGQAEPGSEVEVLANGEVVLTMTTEPDGNFADYVETPLDAGPVELGLRMTTSDGMEVTSADTIVIYVPEGDDDMPVVLRTTPGGATEILQRSDQPAPGTLTIDAIDYDEAGNAIFSGQAEPGSVVQIFANGNPVGETSTDDAGRWSLSTTIPPGRYSLLIVQLDEDGDPKTAIEVPFEQAALEDVVIEDGQVIVQPGNSLWVISRKVYGEGTQYTVIYSANAEQIDDPDLIYPGQIFRLPEDEEAGEEATDDEDGQ